MNPTQLKVGDRIRITKIPGEGISSYYLHPETKAVYKKILARKRAVRISEIDEYGVPWYICKFRCQNGKWAMHFLSIAENDDNWQLVQRRK